MTQVLAINGSYRHDGVIDHLVGLLATELVERGAEVEVILLREYPIEFCLNCRECTQKPGAAPAQCAWLDEMAELIAMIERADAFVLAWYFPGESHRQVKRRPLETIAQRRSGPQGANSEIGGVLHTPE